MVWNGNLALFEKKSSETRVLCAKFVENTLSRKRGFKFFAASPFLSILYFHNQQ